MAYNNIVIYDIKKKKKSYHRKNNIMLRYKLSGVRIFNCLPFVRYYAVWLTANRLEFALLLQEYNVIKVLPWWWKFWNFAKKIQYEQVNAYWERIMGNANDGKLTLNKTRRKRKKYDDETLYLYYYYYISLPLHRRVCQLY